MFNCINLIKITIKNNRKGFIIKKNKKNLNILILFIKINIIKFIKIKDKNIIVYLNYFNKKPIYKNIINYYKTNNKKIISLKNIIKINKKYNWIFIISTSKGLINNFEAEKKNIGGLILAKIWN